MFLLIDKRGSNETGKVNFWGSLSLKILLEDSSPAPARLGVEDEFAGKLLRIRRSRKPRDRCWLLIGHKQLQKSIRISRGTGLLKVASQGLSRPFLKTFATIYADPTYRSWVSDDAP